MIRLHGNMDHPFFQQVIDRIGEMILSGELKSGDRVPSVREMAAKMQLNTTTIVKAYDRLQIFGVIKSIRAVGFEVLPEAKENIINDRKRRFIEGTWPVILDEIRILQIDKEQIINEIKNLDYEK